MAVEGCAPASSGIFACRLERKRDRSLEEEEGNFGVRVDVCPSDKSNEIHYNRGKLRSTAYGGSLSILFPVCRTCTRVVTPLDLHEPGLLIFQNHFTVRRELCDARERLLIIVTAADRSRGSLFIEYRRKRQTCSDPLSAKLCR